MSDGNLYAMRSKVADASTFLKKLANPNRLMIACALVDGEKSVGELEALVGLHQPSLSQQLGVLRDEGLVATRREGKYIYYRLASFEVIQIMQTLSELYCGKVLKKMAGQ